MMENKNLEIRKIDYTFEDKGNIIEGRAIVFESLSNDLGGFKEIIKRGAISQELVENSDVFARTNHSDDYILARSNKGKGSLTLELKDDGLYYSFEAPNTEKGNELVEHIRRGEISQSSFAFMVANEPDAERWIKQDGILVREIYKIGYLGDVAPVFTPAYDATTVSLRALDKVTELNKPEIEEKVDETNELQTRNTNNKKQLNTMEFRLLKAINAVANNKTLDETASAVIGAGAEEMRKSGLSYGGQIQLPTSELRSAITVTAEGEDVVATDLYDIVEPLRAKNVLVQAGAKFLTGLVGDVQVPIMGAGNVTWEGETADASDAGIAFTSVKLSPKRLTAYVDVSKQFLVQDSKSAEALIRQDIINAINTKLEATILGTAAGTTSKPAGIFYGKELNKVTDFAGICDLEADVEDANVNGECKYVMSNKAKAAFRGMAKSNLTNELVMNGGAIDGTPVLNTSNVPNQDFIYGDFSNLAIGQWGAINGFTFISVA